MAAVHPLTSPTEAGVSSGRTGPDPAPAALSVARLTLNDFRCYRHLRIEITPLPVVLTGPNGAGKTNLLEALSFLAPGRGLRRARLADIDRRDGAGVAHGPWAVAAVLTSLAGPVTLGTGREGEAAIERRIVRIDGVERGTQKDLAQQLSVVWLTPEMDRLFLDGPSARRRFVDRLVYGFDADQAARLAAYEHRLRERARLLADGNADPAWLDALEDGMAAHGVAIAAARRQVALRLDRAARAATGPFPKARLRMAGELDGWLDHGPALDAEEQLKAMLRGGRVRDAREGGAAAGPHRSDLEVEYGERDAPAARCSTGEQKALLLSIVLAHTRELAAERGQPPLLLLDEVVAHLDGARRAALFDALGELHVQAWLSGTDDDLFAGLRGRAQFFRVLDATVTPR